MIIKISKIINCSSEHPLYLSTNLLEYPHKNSWRCAKPNEVIANIIFQLQEPSTITGLEIGNYRSCIVIVEASTSEEPDKWVPIVNHQFLSHDEAANSKFRDQVQLFTKRELNPETIKTKFDRVKVTCMQSANPRELFGLEFIILKTEVTLDLGLDVFGRFKLKEETGQSKNEFKEKYLKLFENKKTYKNQLKEKAIENGVHNFTKRQEENRKPKNRPLLEKLESDQELNISTAGPSNITNSPLLNNNLLNKDIKPKKIENLPPIARTLFGDVIPSPKQKKQLIDNSEDTKSENSNNKKQPDSSDNFISDVKNNKNSCSKCDLKSNVLCSTCKLLHKPLPVVENIKPVVINKKEFSKLFEDISFSLSGYVNPQRDEIRKKALKMGAKYVAQPDVTNNKCTHLICAFKNTPKFQQLKGHCKIVNHKFIDDCFNKKKRIPWRRYAVDKTEQSKPESEEEIEGSTTPIRAPSIYEQETDDSDNDY